MSAPDGSFRAAVLAAGNQLPGPQTGGMIGILASWSRHRGSAPEPFDAVDGGRLAGPDGSHPLAAIDMSELVRSSSDGLEGTIEVAAPVRIGEGTHGHLRVSARKQISARAAELRVVGAVIAEQRESTEHRDARGNVTSRDEWVEVHGRLFEQLPLTDVALPTTLAPGEVFESDFLVPGPRLGPVSAHLGAAVIAWAVEAKWDIAMGGDEHVAALLTVTQNIDYLRSGAVDLGAGALHDMWQQGDASLAVKPVPPVAAGSELEVSVRWPSAGDGRGGRLELQADVKAPNGINRLVLWSAPIEPTALRDGVTVRMPIPADAPPTLDSQGVAVSYRIRALVDRFMRSDLAVERAVALM